jgi:mono/diheme cytochrome c family protein
MATRQAVPITTNPTAAPVSTASPILLTPPRSGANPQKGKALYTEKCSPCHGVEGDGSGPQSVNLPEGISPPALNDPEVAFSSTPAEWFSMVAIGNIERFMPGFSSMTEVEIWDVVAYAFSLSIDEEVLKTGETIYLNSCADCHGDQGGGTETGSTLADPTFISERTIEDLESAIRNGTQGEMPAFDDELTLNELQSVSAYLFHLALSSEVSTALDEIIPETEGPNSGTVLGHIINGTVGSDIPAGIEVTLHGFEGQQEVVLESALVDETGTFTFGEYELQTGWVLIATMEYQGVMYGSEIIEYTGQEEVFLPLTFFEPSTDLSAVTVDRLHAIFSVPAGGILEITELWIISNSGDYTIATPDGVGLLEIALPEGASNIRFETGALGDRYIETENGFVDTLPLRPGVGTHELVFSFDIPYNKRLDYHQPMNYPVDAIVILIPATGLDLEGEGIVDMGAREMSGTTLRNYNADPIQAGGSFELRIKGSGFDDSGPEGSSALTIGIGLGTLIIAAAFVGVWWFRRDESSSEMAEEESIDHAPEDEIYEQDRQALLRSIANLDNAFEAGEIEENPYQERRIELKTKLLKLMRAAEHD